MKGKEVVKKDAVGGFDVVLSSSQKENRYAGKMEALRTNEDPNRIEGPSSRVFPAK